jgi:predicted amidohydrolase
VAGVSRRVSVAAVNFALRVVTDFGAFARHVRELLDAAAGADLVVFPELITLELFTTVSDWRRRPVSDLHLVEAYTPAYLELFSDEARRRGTHILAGSHLRRSDGRMRNVAHLFAPGGLLHTHATTHVLPAEAEWRTVEGDALTVVDLPFARVGVALCYEAEIPEVSASLVEQGAEILLVPSFTTSAAGFWRVRHCAHARAIENQAFVVHSCTGGDPGAPLAGGCARAAVLGPCDAPWSDDGVLAEAPANVEAAVRAELDLELLAENRRCGAAPTWRDRRRRSSLYRSWPSHLADPPITREVGPEGA